MKNTALIVRVACLCGFFLFPLSAVCHGQEAEGRKAVSAKARELADLVLPKDALTVLAAPMVDAFVSSHGEGGVSAQQEKEMRAEIAATMKALKGVLTEDVLKGAVAKVYSDHFDDAELDDIIAFYKTATGRKLAEKQGVISGEMSKAVTGLIKQSRGRLAMEKLIASQVGEFEGAALKAYETARKAEPFPKQSTMLLGKWHGSFSDDDGQTSWNYERKSDGSVTIETVTLTPATKEYERSKDAYLWKTEGRVLYEMMISDPTWVDIFLLDSVSEKAVTYRSAIEDIEPSEWDVDTDRRGTVDLPKMPKGWKEISE